MMGGAVAADFELDQWTFFKPSPDDLFRLYGIDLHEVQPYRGFPTLIATRLAAGPDGDARGRLVLPARRRGHGLPHRPREVDDHRGVDRRGREGAALLPQHRLPRALRRGLRQAVRDLLRRRPPPDVRRAAPPRRRPGPDRRLAQGRGPRAARRLPRPPPCREPVHPLLCPARGRPARPDRGLDGGLQRLRVPQPPDGRRLHGAAGRARALAVRRDDGEKAAAQLDDVVGGSKMLLFRLARQRAFDVAGVVAPMAEAYAAAVAELDALCQV